MMRLHQRPETRLFVHRDRSQLDLGQPHRGNAPPRRAVNEDEPHCIAHYQETGVETGPTDNLLNYPQNSGMDKSALRGKSIVQTKIS